MNYQFRSRLSQFLLLLFAILACHLSAPRTEAMASEPTELYATSSDGTPLHWVVYTPAGTGPWPAVLVIHGGGFTGGAPTSAPESVTCGRDLAAAGFIALSIEYRLAPLGFLEGQTSDGRFPDQSDDVKLAVLAARSDPRCNGKVGSVGGSAGGYQTAFVAGTGTIGRTALTSASAFLVRMIFQILVLTPGFLASPRTSRTTSGWMLPTSRLFGLLRPLGWRTRTPRRCFSFIRVKIRCPLVSKRT